MRTNQPTTAHPKGLYLLFLVEMWERFSYYGMRALLVLYLVKHLKFSDLDAGIVYGAYTGLVYLTPLLGGYLSDNYLGNIKSIYIGGILMMFGHMSLAVVTSMIVSYVVGTSPELLQFFFTGAVKWIVIFAPLVAVLIMMSEREKQMSFKVAEA